MKKFIIGGVIAALCAACAVTGAIVVGSRHTADAEQTQLNISELKVGKYYPENFPNGGYIEVFPDKSMQLCDFVISGDANEAKLESLEIFTSRKYYAIKSEIKFIGLSDVPCNEVSVENGNMIGYTLENEDLISFSSADYGILTYRYRADQ